MSGSVEVMAVLLPQAGTNDTVARVRWFLREPGVGPQDFSFPLPEDRFRVEIRKKASGEVVAQQDVAPHPYAMLEPPRTSQKLADAPDGPDGTVLWNALPSQTRPWQPVDPAQTDLRVDDYNTRALGVVHLLGRSHPAHVEQRLRTLALEVLGSQAFTSGAAGTQTATDAEIERWAGLFAAAFRRFPGHPRELLRAARAALRQARAVPTLAEVFPWLAAAVEGANEQPLARDLAALLQLLRVAGPEAARVAGEADDIRALMALRAAQGGDLLDYWCDYDKTIAELPSPNCPPAAQGRRIRAAEAMGLGLDIVLTPMQMGEELEVVVTHVRPPAVAADAQYHFAEGLLDVCAPGRFTMRQGWLGQATKKHLESHPPPAASAFSAWVDYDLVSSASLAAGGDVVGKLPELMAVAKPVTGDGMVTVQVERPPARGFAYDYAFNVYCIWDGEVSGAVQKYFDRPGDPVQLADLKPFLLTRRYSYRRDLRDAFEDPARIAALELLARPPHEALLGLPERIEQNGHPVPYPSKNSAGGQAARLTFNLRELMPAPGAPDDVRWERQGGGLPHEYMPDSVWTVERTRPGTHKLDAAALPQRYRLWVTAVDIFEQESEPIPVVGAEPAEANDASRFIFTPKWRSPPPAAEEVEASHAGAQLAVRWKVASQPLLGTAVQGFRRVPLQAELVVVRRPIRDIRKAASSAAFAGQDAALNPVLATQVQAMQAKGWELWQTATAPVEQPDQVLSQVFALTTGDKGYEYLALVTHAVPEEKLKFVQGDEVQVLRYLRQTGEGDNTRYEEAHWTIPRSGTGAEYRNYPRYGALGASRPVAVLPGENERPLLALENFEAGFVRAAPVRNVLGIDRDQVLAKLIELADPPPAREGLSTAQGFMLDTAVERLKPQLAEPGAVDMVRRLLRQEFIAQSGRRRAQSHPVIGFRGAVRLTWRARRRSDTVPVVQYRAYRGRVAWPLPATPYRARLEDGALAFTGALPALPGPQPTLVVLHAAGRTWTALAAPAHASDPVRIHGLQANDFTAGHEPPPPGQELDVHLVLGELVTHVPASTATTAESYTLALPVGGGYREIAAWWMVAVDCTNKEQWLDETGQPRLLALALPASITPLPIRSLEVRAPSNFVVDAPRPEDFDKLRPYLPTNLPREGLPLFPRTLLSWAADEVAVDDRFGEYIFIERETERDVRIARAPDPAWGLLKAIQASPAGSPWDSAYYALRDWLEGRASPSPGDEFERDEPAFFFPLVSESAWALKKQVMRPAVKDAQGKELQPAVNFIDYFDQPPAEPGGGVEPTLGEKRVRYRAYRVQDLTPEAGPPDPGSFHTRYLLAEPSAWTPWQRPEWPPVRVAHTATLQPRGTAPLVQFSARSGYVNGLWPTRKAADDPFFFRVTFRREVDQAFAAPGGSRSGTVLVGKMLQVPLAASGSGIAAVTADHALEREAPFAERQVRYRVASELVWRYGMGVAGERVLRMFEKPYDLTETVASRTAGVEARMDVELVIGVG